MRALNILNNKAEEISSLKMDGDDKNG